MYRESLIGLALSATLAEMSSSHALTDAQTQQLWNVFDRCMDICLNEAPTTSRVTVRASLPAASPATRCSRNVEADNHYRECDTIPSCSVPSRGGGSDMHITEEVGGETAGDSFRAADDVSVCRDESTNDHGTECPIDTSTRDTPLPHETSRTYPHDDTCAASSTMRDLACKERIIVDDDNINFPVYRCYDGLWTILLKDPVVEVRDEYGIEESIQLDYLKVYIKEDDNQGKSKLARKRGRPRKQ